MSVYSDEEEVWRRVEGSGCSRRAEEKMRVLEEARQPSTSVAEVLRRHQLDGATFYRWERQAKRGMQEALQSKRRGSGGAEREVKRLGRELEKKRRIIAEVVEENLELKRGI